MKIPDRTYVGKTIPAGVPFRYSPGARRHIDRAQNVRHMTGSVTATAGQRDRISNAARWAIAVADRPPRITSVT